MTERSERIDPAGLNLEERIIDIWRCATVIKGGRRFSFASMVVLGNGSGILGLGYGKAREVPAAIEKAVKEARKNLVRVPMYGTTVPHEVRGRFATAKVVLIPALPGTGIIAGQVTRSVLECLGVHDILTKSVGGCNNPKNLAKATMDALRQLRSREQVSRLRGVELPEDPTLAKGLQITSQRAQRAAERAAAGRRPRPGPAPAAAAAGTESGTSAAVAEAAPPAPPAPGGPAPAAQPQPPEPPQSGAQAAGGPG